MSLYRYFAKASKLPDPNGELSASLSPAAIKEANKAVKYDSIFITSHHCHKQKDRTCCQPLVCKEILH